MPIFIYEHLNQYWNALGDFEKILFRPLGVKLLTYETRHLHNIIGQHGHVPILNLASDIGLRYLTLMFKKNLEYRKELTPVRITNSARSNSKDIVTSVSISNDSVAMKSPLRE